MAEKEKTPRDQLEHLLGILKRSTRYIGVVALTAALGIAATVGFAFTRAQNYRSETVLLYREVIPANLLRDVTTGGRNLAGQFREMVSARPILEPIINDLKPDPGLLSARGMNAAIEDLRDSIDFRESGGNTFRIAFVGSSPELSRQVTEQLASRLLEWQKQIQLEAASVTKEFLATERERAEANLTEAEYAMAEFLSRHPEFAFELNTPGPPKAGASIRAKSVTATASEVKPAVRTSRPGGSQLLALERQRDRLAARLATVDEGGVDPGPAPAVTTPEIETAREDLERSRRTLNEKLTQFTSKHPDVIRARREVEEATQRLARLRAAVVAPQPAPVEDRAAEKARLAGQLAVLDEEIADLKRRQASAGRTQTPVVVPEKDKEKEKETARTKAAISADVVVELEAEWARRLRQVQERRERYDSIETTSYTAEIVAASEVARQGTQLTVLDPAYLPTRPAGTSRTIILALGGLLACCFALAIGAGLGLIDDQISSRRDLEALGVGAVLVVVPKEKRRRVKRG